jgi:general secretion pathway protein M
MKAKKSKILIASIPLMFVLLGFLGYQYVYLRIQTDVATIKESQSMKTKTLEKYVTLIAEKPDLEKRLASLKEARKADDTKLVEGKTLSLAAASLQDMVKDIVTRSGGTISSQRVGKPEDLGKFKVITVSIDTVLPDARALRDILYAIETRTPYLTIKDVDIRIRNFKDPREQVVKLDVSAITAGS